MNYIKHYNKLIKSRLKLNDIRILNKREKNIYDKMV